MWRECRLCFLVISFLFIMSGCWQKDNTPEGVLREFIEIRFDSEEGREKILSYLTGDIREMVAGMSDEEFSNFTNMENFKRRRLKIFTKSCEGPTRCFLTYSLSYDTYEGEKAEFSTQSKKVATLEKEEEQWRLADVSTVKTFHESLVPIEPLK